MKTLERVMRVMTHVNIGCALGMVAWTAWSGVQVVNGHYPKPVPARAGATTAASEHRLTAAPPCCLSPAAPSARDTGRPAGGPAARPWQI